MDEKRIDQIYNSLSEYSIDLEPEAWAQGPRYIQKIVALCRNYLNAVSQLLSEVHREKRHAEENLRAREAVFRVSSDELLSNDERIRRLPNIADRQATINVLLSEQLKILDDLKREVYNLDQVEKAIKHRHSELKSTSSDIRLQRQAIRDELDTGSFYGDESDGPTHKKSAPVGLDDEEELDRIIRESKKEYEQGQAEVPVEPSVRAEEETPKQEETEEVTMERFLTSGVTAPGQKEDEYAELLSSL